MLPIWANSTKNRTWKTILGDMLVWFSTYIQVSFTLQASKTSVPSIGIPIIANNPIPRIWNRPLHGPKYVISSPTSTIVTLGSVSGLYLGKGLGSRNPYNHKSSRVTWWLFTSICDPSASSKRPKWGGPKWDRHLPKVRNPHVAPSGNFSVNWKRKQFQQVPCESVDKWLCEVTGEYITILQYSDRVDVPTCGGAINMVVMSCIIPTALASIVFLKISLGVSENGVRPKTFILWWGKRWLTKITNDFWGILFSPGHSLLSQWLSIGASKPRNTRFW